MSSVSLSQMNIYPIKSAGGIALDSATLDPRGLRYDRRWMLVDEDGRFISQRELPKMALIQVSIEPGILLVNAPDAPALEVPLTPPNGTSILARVWQDVVEVAPVGAFADRWFSEFLGVSCRLVHLPDRSIRPVDPNYAQPGDRVSLADGFPFLLISEASLEDLNSRLETPLPMSRFRPNLVLRDCGPFAEDGWSRVRIGSVAFRVVKPCARCVITTVDQSKGTKGKEPLRTLSRYRRVGNGVLFGQNLIHDAPGTLSVGDALEIISHRDSGCSTGFEA